MPTPMSSMTLPMAPISAVASMASLLYRAGSVPSHLLLTSFFHTNQATGPCHWPWNAKLPENVGSLSQLAMSTMLCDSVKRKRYVTSFRWNKIGVFVENRSFIMILVHVFYLEYMHVRSDSELRDPSIKSQRSRTNPEASLTHGNSDERLQPVE